MSSVGDLAKIWDRKHKTIAHAQCIKRHSNPTTEFTKQCEVRNKMNRIARGLQRDPAPHTVSKHGTLSVPSCLLAKRTHHALICKREYACRCSVARVFGRGGEEANRFLNQLLWARDKITFKSEEMYVSDATRSFENEVVRHRRVRTAPSMLK